MIRSGRFPIITLHFSAVAADEWSKPVRRWSKHKLHERLGAVWTMQSLVE
jgi:hypothetical protein